VSASALTVVNNTASISGGGLLFASVAAFSLAGSTLTGNSAQKGGGFALVAPSHGTCPTQQAVLSAIVTGNFASIQGGGWYANGCVLNVTSSVVSNNSVVGQNARGGGFSLDDTSGSVPSLYLTNITASGNVVSVVDPVTVAGGAYLVAYGQGSGGFGAVILSDGDAACSALTLANSTVSAGSASNGGGLYIDGRCIYTTVASSTLANNSATDGGALMLRLLNASTVTVTASFFLGNVATTGAALSAYPGAVRFARRQPGCIRCLLTPSRLARHLLR
jgi:hypothetical protein